jgi:hypothetical protein
MQITSLLFFSDLASSSAMLFGSATLRILLRCGRPGLLSGRSPHAAHPALAWHGELKA